MKLPTNPPADFGAQLENRIGAPLYAPVNTICIPADISAISSSLASDPPVRVSLLSPCIICRFPTATPLPKLCDHSKSRTFGVLNDFSYCPSHEGLLPRSMSTYKAHRTISLENIDRGSSAAHQGLAKSSQIRIAAVI